MLQVGDIVCRGPSWAYGDQDGQSRGGKIAIGKVGHVYEHNNIFLYRVDWKNAAPHVYRCNEQFKDIMLYKPVKSLEELL